jgi:hypothetical protein
MRPTHIPGEVQSRLDKVERHVAQLTQQLGKNQEAIANARQRLTGGFQRDEEYHDMVAVLAKLVADKPSIEAKLDDAQFTFAECKSFLADLPDDVTLELARVKPNGGDLDSVRAHIADAEDEIARLTAMPAPASDIQHRIERYVAALARPQVTGTGAGQTLCVSWPDDMISVLALLLGDRMVEVLSQEVERMANDQMPLAQRKKRIGELKSEIDTLQRHALALGAGTSGLPPAVVLGVRVAETKASRAA